MSAEWVEGGINTLTVSSLPLTDSRQLICLQSAPVQCAIHVKPPQPVN